MARKPVADVVIGDKVTVGLSGQFWAYHNPCEVVAIKRETVKLATYDRDRIVFTVKDKHGTLHGYPCWADIDIQTS